MKKIFLVLALGTSGFSYAQNGVRLGDPTFDGNACDRGTARATLSSDAQTVSILFDDYVAEAGGDSDRRERLHCKVSIPVVVPPGYSAGVFKVDYRGFNSLPAGAMAKFSVGYFFGGRTGPRYTQEFNGPLEADFDTLNNVNSANVIWSPCGRSLELRAHSIMVVKTNRRREQAMSAIDTLDVQTGAGFIYYLQWKRCTR